MSYNLNLKASVIAEITLLNGNKTDKVIVEYFKLWQTPTSVTEDALKSENPLQVYLNWAKEVCPDETQELPWTYFDLLQHSALEGKTVEFESVDDFPEGVSGDDVHHYETYPSERVEHEKELSDWMKEHDGWKIEWYGM